MNDSQEQYNASQLKQKVTSTYTSLEKKKKLGVFWGGAILSLIWLMVLLFLEELLYLSPSYKIGILLALILTTFISIYTGLRNLTPQTFIDFYRRFSRSCNLKELSYALDLEKSVDANPKLVEAAILKNLEQVNASVLDSALQSFVQNSSENKRAKSRRLFAVASLIVISISSLSLSNSTQRLFQFWVAFEKPNPYIFTITPGTVTLEQGSPFSASISFEGEIPDEVFLALKTPVEEEYRTRAMEQIDGTFSSAPIELNSDISYYIEMNGYKSPFFEAQIELRPRFTELEVVVVPPAYTKLDTTRYQYPFSQISGFQGSKFIVSGIINKELESITLNSGTSETQVSLSEDLSFSQEFEIGTEDTLFFEMSDKSGLLNQNPFRFVVTPRIDAFPFVELIEPSESIESVEPTSLNLLFRSSDDFELTSASLKYELTRAFVDKPEFSSVKLQKPNNETLQSFSWDVSQLNLKPKDVVSFWIEVKDNDGYNGFKASQSQVLTLTVPSLVDYFDDLGDKEDEVETDLDDISSAFEEIQDQYDTFKEQLKENPETDFEQQRQLEEVTRQQEELEQRIEELNEKFDEIKDELSENNLLSDETMEAYEELQKLMEQIDDPAFREALEKLQEQMRTMSPEQLREAMKDVEFNEELYKERLERTIELFKQLKLISDLEKLAQSYEDLAEQEEELQAQDLAPEDEKEQRESTLEQLEQLKEQTEDLSENTSDKNEQSISEYQEESQEQLNEVSKELEDLLDELEELMNDEDSSASERAEKQKRKEQLQQSISKAFEKLAEMTRQQMESMNQQQMNINIAGLQYILYSLLNLSVEQENLVSYASATENRSQAYIEFARDQKNLEGIFTALSDSLFQLSTEIPQFSNDINKKKLEVEQQLTTSLEQMAERNQSRSSIATRQALGGINEISFMIANLLEQIQDQQSGNSSGSGQSTQQMMEQLQQMGENQKQLNQQIQDMINDMQGERLTQDQMGRLNQMSKQQNEIRKQLEELRRSGELEGGDKIGSDIQRMIEEMEDTINDLRGGAVDPTMIERQQNILSRMLEAERALEERDEEEKREGATGNRLQRPTPPELTLEELEKQIRNRLNDPNFTKYSSDYQRLIEKYFELLKEIQSKEIQ